MLRDPRLAALARHERARCVAVDNQRCVCGGAYYPDESAGKLACEACGERAPLGGVVFAEAQLYTENNQRPRAGPSNNNRHLVSCLTHLYGLEPESELPPGLVDRVRERLRATRVPLPHTTVAQMRRVLADLGLSTAHNCNTTLLLVKITKVPAPRADPALHARIEEIFALMGAYKEPMRAPGAHRDYLVPTIGRIVDAVADELYDAAGAREARRIQRYIFYPSDKTTTSTDNKWAADCARLGLPYRAVDRAQSHQPTMLEH